MEPRVFSQLTRPLGHTLTKSTLKPSSSNLNKQYIVLLEVNHPNTSIIKLFNDEFVLVSMTDIYTPQVELSYT